MFFNHALFPFYICQKSCFDTSFTQISNFPLNIIEIFTKKIGQNPWDYTGMIIMLRYIMKWGQLFFGESHNVTFSLKYRTHLLDSMLFFCNEIIELKGIEFTRHCSIFTISLQSVIENHNIWKRKILYLH